MFHVKYFFYFIPIHFILCTPQLNLYYTDGIIESNDAIQHHCLRTVVTEDQEANYREIMTYCMSEFSFELNTEDSDFISKFTFFDLLEQNITSQQLYLWSAPIDTIENYQFYLNQFSTKNDLALSKEVFNNCTMPRFGPMCQYQLYYHYSYHSSLYEIIYNFYRLDVLSQTTLTCYTHLKCNDDPYSSCLDWSEICDGEINCLDGAFDEEHCWQLEINECKDNEYRCKNGQCIPQSFYQDDFIFADCLDQSDQKSSYVIGREYCQVNRQQLLKCDDIPCQLDSSVNFCLENRLYLLVETMHSTKNISESEKCWSAFKCLLNFKISEDLFCDELCENAGCVKNVQKTCPDMLYFPNVPLLFGNVYLAFRKSDLKYGFDFDTTPRYICYNTSHYDELFSNISKIFFNNMTCVNYKPFSSGKIPWESSVEESIIFGVSELYKLLKRYHFIFNYTSTICNRSNMYQCTHLLKCISIYRLMDNIDDCSHQDDENILIKTNNILIEHFEKTRFKCEGSGKSIPQSSINNGKCDCGYTDDGRCDDESIEINYLRRNILFQHICDGFIDHLSIIIQGKNETDETECEQWQCNNIYTRCNDVWNCPNGEDESGCLENLILNCSSKEHLCVSPHTNQFQCLSIEKANDGYVDCLGGTDETTRCRTNIQIMPNRYFYEPHFSCLNQTLQLCIDSKRLCNGFNDCQYGDDEQFCTRKNHLITDYDVCSFSDNSKNFDVEKFFCDYRLPRRYWKLIYFKVDERINLKKKQVKNIEKKILSDSSRIKRFNKHQPRCHRGLDLIIWLKTNLTRQTCLCPSTFYGLECQYQNERISLIIKLNVLSNSLQIPFSIIILLIDNSDKRIIHSYEQFTYLSIKHCQMKFYISLLYLTRPKDSRKKYSIHIDIYEKISLNYRGSLLYPVSFPFLPVQRLVLIVNIPRSDDKSQICIDNQCIHGKCIKYSNNHSNIRFCQCNSGWSGRYCTIEHHCRCSSDSLCIGISGNNRSICVCPINKSGSRCFLNDRICQRNVNSTCKNGGQCISNFDLKLSNEDFLCICRKGFSGNRCEIIANKLVLSFGKDLIVSEQIFVHFIDIKSMRIPLEFSGRATTFRRIPFEEDSVIIYWSERFDLVFTEFANKIYYLTFVQNFSNKSSTIIRRLNSSDRCPSINELFNESFVKMHLIRRIKYYHFPCQNSSLNISCFYDEIHFCLCYEFENQRLSNCFKFDHNLSFDCSGQSECENGGRCLQNKITCPTTSLCICPSCFYGSRCQFRTSGFGLSLDAILGYQIFPNVSLRQQPITIKISLSITISFLILGVVNGILSFITFKNKRILEVGCGLYLLCSSLTTLFLLIIFGLKFVILLLTQMRILSDRSFLSVQCHSMDFLLRICLSLDQWLNACVAVERAITAVKGARFSKKKSKQVAKFVLIIVLIVIIGSYIHDPIYRHLIDEEYDDGDDEKRIWCTVTYPSSIQIYNSLIDGFHFFGPFILNFVSTIVLITKKSRQQLKFRSDRTYKEILLKQFGEHKHLLTAPIVLVILALPRLIITFVSKCMKSVNDPWLFLVAYFIPFIAPMLTFVVFVVPSKFYMKEFRKTVAHYRISIQRRYHWTS